MGLLLGIDLGTSYFKVGLFDERGMLQGLGRVAVEKREPALGWSELPVDAFWTALRRGLAVALAQAGARAEAIVGLSYSSQASTFLLLVEDDSVLTPLIMWTDARGAPAPAEFVEFAGTDAFRRTIGFGGLSGQSAATKWRWFQREAPAVWARARRIMTISDYFTFALTGERVGDASTAAFLALYDLGRGSWWPEALRVFGLTADQLSTPLRPGSPCGMTTTRAMELLGVPARVPFAVGALDHHAAAIGSGLERFADLSISTGTVLAALGLVAEPSAQTGCYHGRHVDGARCWRLAFDPNGAGQLEKYQRQRASDWEIEELLERAVAAPPGAAWRGEATEHGGAVRSILERMAATHRDLVKRVAGTPEAFGALRRIAATGGGARSPAWQQINADVFGIPMAATEGAEPACLGAAVLAAAAAGVHATIDEAAGAMVRAGRIIEPDSAASRLYRDVMP